MTPECKARLIARSMTEHRHALTLARQHLTDAGKISTYSWSTPDDVAAHRRHASEWIAEAKHTAYAVRFLRGL